ncbi:hypothetical protein Cflav_PD1741 [Pedosphaera parvula Ellin514]|uniref:Uncharacterized protein n=1 Tax=Pedosphaera parvula (strain Ellin514) TaxID=320771 RepID=B9XNL1_PEDPL|nr:hypothetical protein Cflav_PD1741 [Pedosphaera parvula Ellin514]
MNFRLIRVRGPTTQSYHNLRDHPPIPGTAIGTIGAPTRANDSLCQGFPISIGLCHFQRRDFRRYPSDACGQTWTVDMRTKVRMLACDAKDGAHGALAVQALYHFRHHHCGRNNQMRNARIAGWDNDAGTDREKPFRTNSNGCLHGFLNFQTKEISVCGIDTTIHKTVTVRRRDDAAVSDVQEITMLNFNFRKVCEGIKPGVYKGWVNTDEMEMHRRSNEHNLFAKQSIEKGYKADKLKRSILFKLFKKLDLALSFNGNPFDRADSGDCGLG